MNNSNKNGVFVMPRFIFNLKIKTMKKEVITSKERWDVVYKDIKTKRRSLRVEAACILMDILEGENTYNWREKEATTETLKNYKTAAKLTAVSEKILFKLLHRKN